MAFSKAKGNPALAKKTVPPLKMITKRVAVM
jgi:hypothetical protein